jgi:hypothetical protein
MSVPIPQLCLSTVQASETHAVATQNPRAICSRQRTDVSDPICRSRRCRCEVEYLRTFRKRPTSNAQRPTPNFRLDDHSCGL